MMYRPPHYHWLPSSDLPQSERRTFAPWIDGFVGLSTEMASQRLRDRWASISRPAFKLLRNKLESFEVRAVVVTHYGGAIYCVRPNANQDRVGNVFLLPAPPSQRDLQRCMKSMYPSGNSALQEFLLHFGGLAEAYNCGSFVSAVAPWATFSNPGEQLGGEIDRWEGAIELFNSSCGDRVLLRPKDGKLAWYLHEDNSIKALAGNLDGFVRQYATSRDVAWPYDPWGPPDHEVSESNERPSLRIFCDDDPLA